MSKPPRAQDLNAPILKLLRDRGALADRDLHGMLALEFGDGGANRAICSVDQMLFSASVNLAKRRLIRYGLLKLDATKRVALTAQGELFLARGFTRLDARTRRTLDEAWLRLSERVEDAPAAEAEHASASSAEPDDTASHLHDLLVESKLEFHRIGDARASVPVWSRLRSWIVELYEADGWIGMRTHVMALPAAPAARAAVVGAAMSANAELTVWRFAVGAKPDALFLEAEYRADHLDGDALAGLVLLVRSCGDAQYERLVKVALAPAPLDALEEAFKRSA